VKNELIICFGYSQWGRWRQDQEIAMRLARENTVIYVEAQSRRSGRLDQSSPALRWINDHLAVLRTPSQFGYGGRLPFGFLRKAVARASVQLSKQHLFRAVDTILREIDRVPTATLFFDPLDLELAGRFGEEVTTYRVYDEPSLFPSFRLIRDVIEEVERECLPKMDLVFASSMFQYNRRVRVNGNTHFLPNAGDFERYHRSLTRRWNVPADLDLVPMPRIFFAGGIDYRIDFELLHSVARCRPDWSIVFLGNVKEDATNGAEELSHNNNVFFLGNKRPEALPGYLHHCQVSIIPYKINESTSTMYPWKVHEHLAAGKPIVATPLPELELLGDVVSLAASPARFVEQIDDAMERDSVGEVRARVNVARANSWDERVEQMTSVIDEVLECRRRRCRRQAVDAVLPSNSEIPVLHGW